MLILSILFIMFVFVSWKTNMSNAKINENCKTRELYNGIYEAPKVKPNQKQEDENEEVHKSSKASELPRQIKIARLYSSLFLIKILFIVLIVVVIPSSISLFALKVLSLLILQTTYILYTIFVRIFAESKNQVVEVCNELVFFTLIILLMQLYSESKWTDLTTNIFIGIIVSQLWILLIVSMTNAIARLIRFIIHCKDKNKRLQFEEAHNENDSEESNKDPDNSQSINEENSQYESNVLEHYISNHIYHQDLKQEDKKEVHEQYGYRIV